MSFRPDDQCAEHGRLLVIAERLYDAIVARDQQTVLALLEVASAASLPREVREEALVIVALPATSLRVPMQLLRFHHRMTELMRDGDVEETRLQLEMRLERWEGRRSA